MNKPWTGRLAALSFSTMLALVNHLCPAANLNWAVPQKIIGDADVSLNGMLVRAINATPTNTTLAIDVTLNGVTFVAARKNGSGLYVAPGGDTFLPTDTSSVGPTSGGFQAFGQGGVPFNTLSAAYSNLLCTAYWNDGTDIGNTWAATAGYNWTLNNLTVGRTYELQVWVNDSRLSNLGQNNPGLFTSVMDTNGNSVNLEHNVDNILGGVGQYVIGTFTADATSQTLKLIGGNTVGADTSGSTVTSLLNAYQLRDISPTAAPRFTSVKQSGTEIILGGTNGPANGAYEMLRSLNVSVPVGDWQGVGIRTFDANGDFSFTKPISPGDAEAFYRLRVVSSVPVFAPAITGQPQDAAIAVGQNANFNVTATGTEPMTYYWYYNANTLLLTGSSASLAITNAQLTNAGKYSVTVSNLVGSAPSVFATLTVTNNTQPPGIASQPTNVTLLVGQTANFSVAANGAPPLRYQWYYNTNTALAGQTNATLTLNNVQSTNAGQYSVTITNDFGSTNSLFAQLTVSTNSGVAIPDGFATQNGGTTGGGNTTPTIVTTAAAFRSAVSGTTPRVIVVQGRIDLAGDVSIGSNKTIMGADTNSGLFNGTIGIGGTNYIFQNLTFGPASGDVMEISGARNIFITKCEFYGSTDELCSIVRQADFVTVSWSKFYFPNSASHSFAHLIGNGDDVIADRGKLHVTLHHNWYAEGLQGRLPRVRFGQVHIYNNYYNAVDTGYCIGIGFECHIRLENTHFHNSANPWADYGGSTNGEIGWAGLKFQGSTQPTFMPNVYATIFTPPYSYTLDPVDNVQALVTAGAGNVMP